MGVILRHKFRDFFLKSFFCVNKLKLDQKIKFIFLIDFPEVFSFLLYFLFLFLYSCFFSLFVFWNWKYIFWYTLDYAGGWVINVLSPIRFPETRPFFAFVFGLNIGLISLKKILTWLKLLHFNFLCVLKERLPRN